MSKPLCIYHSSCQDGFASAWIVYNHFGKNNVDFFPGIYQNDPPDVTGKDVIMVDFSYKKDVILKMAETAKSILILNHHKSAIEDLYMIGNELEFGIDYLLYEKFLPKSSSKISTLFDMERSGAGI